MGLLDRFKKTKTDEKKKEVKKPQVSVVKKETKPIKEKTSTRKVAKKEFSNAYLFLNRPMVTEKSVDLNTLNQYVFEVTPNANKVEIKKAIQDLYGVKVDSVNIIKVRGKARRIGRHEGWRPGFKKAIVFLSPGEKLEIIAR